MTMLSVIMAYRRNNPGTWSAVEIETFTLACMAAAVDDAINAVHNNSDIRVDTIREWVDPERLLEEYREDFESKAIDFAVAEQRARPVSSPALHMQSVGRGLREPPGPVDMSQDYAGVYHSFGQRRRELDQPAAMPLGHPVVVATTDKDQDGNAVERLVHLTTDEVEAMEAARFAGFDPEAAKRELDEDMRRQNEAAARAEQERDDGDDLQALMDRDRE